jgi:hypothetical protein
MDANVFLLSSKTTRLSMEHSFRVITIHWRRAGSFMGGQRTEDEGRMMVEGIVSGFGRGRMEEERGKRRELL